MKETVPPIRVIEKKIADDDDFRKTEQWKQETRETGVYKHTGP